MEIRFHDWEWFNLLIHLWNGFMTFMTMFTVMVASEWGKD
jgi:hypothetical protein